MYPSFVVGPNMPGAQVPGTFILIPGRTSKQGCGISEDKFNAAPQRPHDSYRHRTLTEATEVRRENRGAP